MKEAGVYHAVINDTIRTCDVLSQSQNKILGMSVFPNPAEVGQNVTVNIICNPEDLEGASLKMFGIDGQLLRTIPVSGNETTFSIPNSKGIAVIKLVSNTINREVKLIVK